MSRRSSMFMLAVVMAIPAYAADPAPGQDDSAIARHASDAAPLAALPPVAPILSGAQGAMDAGGGSTIFVSALYGGLAGAAIGAGVALIENGNWGRDIGIGAGVGLLVGAVLGAAHAFGDERGPYPTTDGLRSTDRDPVITGRTLALGGRF